MRYSFNEIESRPFIDRVIDVKIDTFILQKIPGIEIY